MFRKLPLAGVAAAIFIGSVIVSGYNPVHAATCGTSSASSTQSGLQTVADSYQQWKNRYLTANGADGALRVQRSANDNYDTVSEGIAYGMLFAVYNNDRTTFDKLWAYEQNHLDGNGLMNWRIGAGGNTIGYNAATDADLDMALALAMADKTWGGYKTTAVQQIQRVERTEIENGSNALKPGDVWGGAGLLNPSYLSPAYYPVFKAYTGNSIWDGVTTASYNTYKSIRQNTPAKNSGLFPDWSNDNGYQTSGMGYSYGYDAVRAPLRLALANNWSCDTRATDALAPFNAFFQRVGVNNIVSGYNLDGSKSTGDVANGAYLGPVAAAAASSSSSASYRSSTWNALANLPTGGYYNDSIRLFGLMIASGQFVNPLEAKTVPPLNSPAPTTTTTTTPVATSKLDIWWPSDGSAVSGVQPFKAMLQNNDVANYSMYWQVDGGQLNPMSNNYDGYQHKQSDVDVSGWNWRGAGPYTLTFTAKNSSGVVIGTNTTKILIR